MGDSTVNLRVKYILVRYNFEKDKLNVAQRLALLDNWIASCTKFEEYEMAQALLALKEGEIKSMTEAENKPVKKTLKSLVADWVKILKSKWRT